MIPKDNQIKNILTYMDDILLPVLTGFCAVVFYQCVDRLLQKRIKYSLHRFLVAFLFTIIATVCISLMIRYVQNCLKS